MLRRLLLWIGQLIVAALYALAMVGAALLVVAVYVVVLVIRLWWDVLAWCFTRRPRMTQ